MAPPTRRRIKMRRKAKRHPGAKEQLSDQPERTFATNAQLTELERGRLDRYPQVLLPHHDPSNDGADLRYAEGQTPSKLRFLDLPWPLRVMIYRFINAPSHTKFFPSKSRTRYGSATSDGEGFDDPFNLFPQDLIENYVQTSALGKIYNVQVRLESILITTQETLFRLKDRAQTFAFEKWLDSLDFSSLHDIDPSIKTGFDAVKYLSFEYFMHGSDSRDYSDLSPFHDHSRHMETELILSCNNLQYLAVEFGKPEFFHIPELRLAFQGYPKSGPDPLALVIELCPMYRLLELRRLRRLCLTCFPRDERMVACVEGLADWFRGCFDGPSREGYEIPTVERVPILWRDFATDDGQIGWRIVCESTDEGQEELRE